MAKATVEDGPVTEIVLADGVVYHWRDKRTCSSGGADIVGGDVGG